MFGKKWDEFWKSFETTMDKMGPAIEESVDITAKYDGRGQSIIQKNGHVEIRGNIKSLRINGRTIRLPKEVMEGT